MAKLVYIPKVRNQSDNFCVLVEWNKKTGDQVLQGNHLFMFDRNGMKKTVSSPVSGYLLKKYYYEEENIPENRPVCIVGEKNEDIELIEKRAGIYADSKDTDKKGSRNKSASHTFNSSAQSEKDILNLIREAEDTVEQFKHRLEAVVALNRNISEEAPFVITFAGRFKTGKSSLLNALLGIDLLPTKATTATTIVTRIFRGETLCAWVRKNGENIPISVETAKNLILNYEPENENDSAEVIFEAPVSWLPPYVELRDTPGTSDRLVLEEMTESALKDTDLCVCIYDAGAMFSEAEREGTRRLHKQLGGNLVYVVNRINLLNSMERIQEVEDVAKNFFRSMNYSFDAMGKHFVMCSAPGMIDLDGFDIWLKGLVDAGKIGFLGDLRRGAACAQTAEEKSRIRASADEYKTRISQAYDLLVSRHSKIIEEKKREIKKKVDAEALKIRSDIPAMENRLTDLNGLEDEISLEITGDGWQEDYSVSTKVSTKKFFKGRFKTLKKEYESARFIPGPKVIDQVFSTLTFPGPKFTSVKATGGEVAGWGGAGAFIGTLFAPGIGTAIGAAIGAAIGGSGGSRNDSVSNTMAYVRNTVLPALRSAFSAAATEAARQRQNSCESSFGELESGLENTITQLKDTMELVNGYCEL